MKLFEELNKNANTYSNVIALKDCSREVSYGQLWNIISVNRNNLIKSGISKRVVAYKIAGQFDFIIDFISLLAAECWVIPIPPDIMFNLTSIGNEELTVLNKNNFIKKTICNKQKEFYVDENQCGIYHMTSGSSGEIKLCKRTAYALFLEGKSYGNLMSLCNSKILSMAPIYHSFALGAACMASLLSASALHVIEKFSPRKSIDIINLWRVNVLVGVPIMIKALSCVNIDRYYDFSCLSNVLVGTGNVNEQIAKCFKNRFGIDISANYGSTETGGLISRMGKEPNESIGQAMHGVDIKLILPDGSEALEGEIGEAYVKCEYMMEKYVYGECTFDSEGYLPTGDLMKKDKNGNYYIVGRKKNIINIGGKKVNPCEVEKIMIMCPDVKDCVVMKGIRKNGDEFVKAIIVSEKKDVGYIRRFLLEKIAGYKIPSVIEFVDQIERNKTGKYISNNVVR